MKIHLATDQAGLDLKNTIRNFLIEQGHEVKDNVSHEYDPLDDYRDFIFPCAKAVEADIESRGIILGGSGQGEAMAANRVKGVRAAVYYNGPDEIIKLSRQHNNANILSLVARFMTEDVIYKVINLWLVEPFGGGRHKRRIEKLDQ